MRRNGLLLFVLAAGGVLLGAMGVTFLWPDAPVTDRPVVLGDAEAFTPGSVTTFRLDVRADAPVVLPADAPHTRECVRDGQGIVLHLVRLPEGEFIALSAKSPHLGETVPWLADFEYGGTRGWFRELCHGETFAMDGTRVFGPAPRGLDRYEVDIEDGRVVVDPGRLTEGASGTVRQDRGDETPTPAATEPAGA